MASGDGGIGGILVPESDVADGVTVDTYARDGAVDLESRLEIEDRAVQRETHDDHRRRRCRPHSWSVVLRRLRQRATALGVVAGKVGFVSLATHCGVVSENS